MRLSEAAHLLSMSREVVKDLILQGIDLGDGVIKLNAQPEGTDFYISEDDLDAFLSAKEKHQPGRNPPISLRRRLRVECNMACAICKRDGPLEYHHIIEYSQVKHYDEKNMMAVCSNCHTRITRGEIDYIQQKMHKAALSSDLGGKIVEIFSHNAPVEMQWEDIARVIQGLDEEWDYDGQSRQALINNKGINLERKNFLNNMDEDYFTMMRQSHEPYFRQVNEFLRSPTNRQIKKKYLSLISDLQQIVFHNQAYKSGIHKFLTALYGRAAKLPTLQDNKLLLAVLISFMYFNCDLGIKDDTPG